jgi:putative heme-binding domain-containing protein
MQNLITYSQEGAAPANMRAEAIDALSVWPKPSVLDRVDGRLRGPVERSAAPLLLKSTDAFITLLKNKDLPVRISAAKAIHKLNIKQAAPSLLAVLKTDREAEMRVEALKALVALQDPLGEQGIRQALSDKEKKVRVAGLDLLEKMNIPKPVMVTLLTDVITSKTMEEQQAAVLTLGKVFNDMLNKMAAGKLSPDIYLELGEAIDSTRDTKLSARYKEISSKLSPDDLMASYASSLLGGNPDKGKQIFFRNQNAQCMKCHSYDDRGGNAGPRLNGVGKRISREQILEALISPSTRLSPGFGMVTLELKDGQKLTGVLQGESKTGLKVKVGLEPDRTINSDQIVKKTFSPSSMPDMKTVLSKKEIRDLVSFLADEKGE